SESERPARGSSRGGSRGSSRRSAPAKSRRGGRGRGGDDEEEEDGHHHHHGRRGGRHKQQSNPTLLIVAGVMVVAAIGAGFFLMNKNGGELPQDTAHAKDNASKESTLTDVTNGTADDAAKTTENTAQNSATQDAPPAEVADETTQDNTSDSASATGDAGTEAPKTDKPAEEPKKPAKDREFKDPASVDLLAIEDFGLPKGCDADRWAELQELARTAMDPDAGAAGRRAGTALVEEGKFAIPAILNEMKKLDLTENFQFLTANAAQKTLTEICNGINLGWQYPDQEPDTWHYYDKKAIFNWCELWKVWDEDHDQFMRRTKRTEQPAPADEPAPATDDVGGEDDLDSLDDI
ncbi:MAG: hypothetical protein KDC14_04655, partial [Planctomycetes bacterium]|nr:hypothetical protein [Planctomycetota bacterium]